MAQKNIYEYDAKKLIASELPKYYPDFDYHNKLVVINCETDLEKTISDNSWINTEKVVVKPDQLFGKRGKANLLLLDANCDEMKDFCYSNLDRVCEIGNVSVALKRLLVEPFIPHEKEYYVSITTERNNDVIHFSFEGGIFVEENWDKVVHVPIPVETDINTFDLEGKIPNLGDLKDTIIPFIKGLYQVFINQDFTFLEINPFAITKDKKVVPLDVKARLDNTAAFLHTDTWGNPEKPIEFPAAFGQIMSAEEKKIMELDEKTGASLKLTILNRNGRIWTMVAGGGASVVYTDTIADLGLEKELSNYGEYSGNPSQEHTEIYAQTLIDLITENPDPKGREKYFIIGGGIANFTDVKATFGGIVKAIKKSVDKLKKANVKILVRRGGPNEKQGLDLMRQVGEETGIPIEIYDRYSSMTRPVARMVEKIRGE
ncbi:MAG TPA: ATP citrate lyase citrate-binding domain-containing protein [Candidatus Nanopelagicaceae bacterium]|nr:ATP citrate lyase citrate-binding domain-containing protein [Candidatus Nanopelagicaceae bacterium]